MPLVVGLLLVPVVLLIARASESVRAGKKTVFLLNSVLILIIAAFYVFVFLTRLPPFDFKVSYSAEYMFFSGGYWVNALVIYVCSPFMWVVTVHFARRILRFLRVKKNSVIKRDRELPYYRDDLDRIAPGVLLFTSELSVDTRRSMASEILKLKLLGYVAEEDGYYVCTGKAEESLATSEKMLLQTVKTGFFDPAAYRNALEAEALAGKYLIRKKGGVPRRLLRIVLTACIPGILFLASVRLDDYVSKHYHVYPDPVDGGYEVYLVVDRWQDAAKLMDEVTDKTHLYGSYSVTDHQMHYSPWVKADRLEYSVVQKAYLLRLARNLSMGIALVSVFFAAYHVAVQIRYFDRDYRRTGKGNALLNKAYALKNYLKEYSLIKDRSEQDLFLWEYYLVYAVALEVNKRTEDEVLKKLMINTI